jgi:chemotaxis protein MotA
MNFSLVLGIISAGLTLWFGVFKSSTNSVMYLDTHALILVCGGTFAASLIAIPFTNLVELVDTLIAWPFRKKTPDHLIVEELYEVAMYYRKYKDLSQSVDFAHPFIREGFELVKSDNFNERHIEAILTKRINTFKKKLINDAKVLTSLSKFPPAFGLLGASTGMIAMMLNLNAAGTQKMGASMAIALVATFWGIALANLIFLPLADYANKIAQDESHTRMIIMEGLILIKHQEEPHVIVELLKSHLPPESRMKVKTLRSHSVNHPENKKVS